MKLSKLLKIMDPDHTILIVSAKSQKAIFKGEVKNFSDDKEWKVKKINNSYSYSFEIYVKEVKKQESADNDGPAKSADVYEALKNAPL